MSGSKIEITTVDDNDHPTRETLEVTVNAIQSPRHSTSGSTRGTSPQSTPAGKSNKLAKVSEELVFESEGFLKISGRIHIKNLTLPSSSIVFKIKTTNPGKFHVWPTIGLISDRGSAVSKVTLKPNIDVHSVRQDKFQVEVMIVPRDLISNIQAIEDDDQFGNSDETGGRRDRRSSLAGEPGHSLSTLAELNESWKKIAATGTPSETHRISITVDPNFLQPEGPPVPDVTDKGEEEGADNVNGDKECIQRIEMLETRLDSLDDNMTEQFTYLQFLIYALIGTLLVFTLINFGAHGVVEFFMHLAPANVKTAVSFLVKTDQDQSALPQLAQILPTQLSAPPVTLPAPPVDRTTFGRDICPLFG